jgi:transposase
VSVGKRLGRLEARLAQVERENVQLRARVAELEAVVAERDAAILELQTKVGQNSTNSHKPPSSDPPGTRPPKKRTGRKRGGQPGHEPHSRVFFPPEMVTARTEAAPDECDHCGSRRLDIFAEPRRHQVIDVPEPKPDVHEYAMYGALCHDCGEETWASLPDGVPRHMFGHRLLALIALLAGMKISRRRAQEILREVFGIPVSLGALSEAEERASTALAAPNDEALAHVRAQPVKHVDATTWRVGGALCSLWTIATKLVTVFAITADGAAATIRDLLATLHGFLVTDRGTTFGFWAMDRRQVCWAHLVRKFISYTQRHDEGARIGGHLLLFTQCMLFQWHRVRDGTLSRRRFQAEMAPVRIAIENLLLRGASLGLRGFSGSCEDILEHRDALFTFIDVPDIDPTNNLAERVLREFVLWRKVSQGSQSERGCLFAQRVMTVFQSLRQQRRSVFAFLVEACHAAQHGLPTPSLIPATR